MARAVATPLVLGETLNPPQNGEVWRETNSRQLYAKYLDYAERLRLANAAGLVIPIQVQIGQLIPTYIRVCFEDMYTNGREITASELIDAVKQHAGYTTTTT